MSNEKMAAPVQPNAGTRIAMSILQDWRNVNIRQSRGGAYRIFLACVVGSLAEA
jgi:hypothetical protein